LPFQDSLVSDRRQTPRARNLELALTLIVLAGSAPAMIVAVAYLWKYLGDAPEVQWTLMLVVVGCWLAAMAAVRQITTRSLHLVANLLGALR
jgi:hypothetical protein